MCFPQNFNKQAIWAVLAILLVWTIILIFSGAVFSGYHLTDDHEIIRIHEDLNQSNFYTVATKWLRGDLSIRFRPFYYVHRILETSIFGTNTTAWEIYRYILAIITTCLLFFFGKSIGLPAFCSLLFALLTLVGDQAEIWWRLGPNETIGIFFFSIALFCLSRQYAKGFGLKLDDSIFVLAMVLATLSKEPFILLIPFVVCLRVVLYRMRGKCGYLQAVRDNLAIIVFFLITMSLELLVIRFFVGLNKISYAGYSGFDFRLFWTTLISLLKNKVGPIFVFGLIVTIILCYKKKVLIKKSVWIESCILFGLIVIPQIVLYMKSGIDNRYQIPVIIGQTLAISFFLKIFTQLYLAPKKVTIGKVYGFLLILTLCIHFGVSIHDVQKYVKDGKSLSAVLDVLEQSTETESKIMIAGNTGYDQEWSYSLNHYLKLVMNRQNTVFYPVGTYEIDDSLISYFGKQLYADSDSRKIKTIFIFLDRETEFLEKSKHWFDPFLFDRMAIGKFVLYTYSKNR